MQKIFDEEMFPPFEGFPKEGIQFLKKLKKNNTREWFTNHKGEYEEHVKFPMQSLICSLQSPFQKFSPECDVHPKRSLFRIHRDTRFSKDKTPYKTHVAAHFIPSGDKKGLEGVGYYMHIEPGEIFVGGGIYMPNGDQLKNIRTAIAEHSQEFLSIIKDKKFLAQFKKIDGTKLQRVPKGFEENHPMIEWLKLKQFFVGVSLPEKKCYEKNFVKEVATICEKASPLVHFLQEACGR